jgi:hypothetical protein
MTKEKAIKVLTEYNRWRRSDKGYQQSPETIGQAIDLAIEILKNVEQMGKGQKEVQT